MFDSVRHVFMDSDALFGSGGVTGCRTTVCESFFPFLFFLEFVPNDMVQPDSLTSRTFRAPAQFSVV